MPGITFRDRDGTAAQLDSEPCRNPPAWAAESWPCLAVGSRHAAGHPGGTVADIAADLGKDRSQVSRGPAQAPSRRVSWPAAGHRDLCAGLVRLHRRPATDRTPPADPTAPPPWTRWPRNRRSLLPGGPARGQHRDDRRKCPGQQQPGGLLAGPALPRVLQRRRPGTAVGGLATRRSGPSSRTSTLSGTAPTLRADVDDFLARLEAARERGYSIVDEEAEPGLYSLAVPVRDFKGEVVAALQIVGIKDRLEPRREACAAALVAREAWLEAAARVPAAGLAGTPARGPDRRSARCRGSSRGSPPRHGPHPRHGCPAH